ncbi:uncharacterized protein K441DRAFT_287010 [Cenococcum geophilum 1.58]|uniref:uncharacterized protein n=1 Tax=Cenococcum geophilum 1.58 TaxID=794803 RepID=UPI00358F11D8|nr:hypothetical protein K441DRAFT_287010 [Cenococcum geophilum 1.58]
MTSPKRLSTTRDSVLIRDLAVQESKTHGCMQYEQTLQCRARNSTESSRTKIKIPILNSSTLSLAFPLPPSAQPSRPPSVLQSIPPQPPNETQKPQNQLLTPPSIPHPSTGRGRQCATYCTFPHPQKKERRVGYSYNTHNQPDRHLYTP